MKQNWLDRTVLARVGRHHFAFLRGYLDGVALKDLAELYLDQDDPARDDLRVAKSTLTWIQEQLVVVAKRLGKPSIARAVRVPPDKLVVQPGAAVPTLKEFQEDRDPYNMYSEADLLALFEEAYPTGGNRQAARKESLRRRQLEALRVLEPLFDVDPQADDLVGAWLHPALAARLDAAGIRTLGQLVAVINQRGYRWWKQVPQFGEKAAAQVIRWLTRPENEAAIGVRVESQGTTPARQLTKQPRPDRPRRFGIVPLEYLVIPDRLRGGEGANRGERCTIDAGDDLTAVLKWLALKPSDSHTWRSYRQHAERFLLFLLLERDRALSDANTDDCMAYRQFLRRLDPETDDPDTGDVWPFRTQRADWTTPLVRKIPRFSEAWRPFEGPLDPKSCKLAEVIARNLCTWLVDVHYLHVSPWKAVPKDGKVEFKADRERSLPPALFRFTLAYLETLTHDAHYYRLRFAFLFAYTTGLRLSELVGAKVGDIVRNTSVDGDGWHLTVMGKGSRERDVPLPSIVLAELDLYLAQRGLPPRALCPSETHLIGWVPPPARPVDVAAVDGAAAEILDAPPPDAPSSSAGTDARKLRGIGPSKLYQVFDEFFKAIAVDLEGRAHSERAAGEAARARGDLPVAMQHYDRMERLLEGQRRLSSASTHWLRHTFGTHFVQAGGALRDLQQLLGHARGETTEIYTTPGAERLYQVVEEFVRAGPLSQPPTEGTGLPFLLVPHKTDGQK